MSRSTTLTEVERLQVVATLLAMIEFYGGRRKTVMAIQRLPGMGNFAQSTLFRWMCNPTLSAYYITFTLRRVAPWLLTARSTNRQPMHIDLATLFNTTGNPQPSQTFSIPAEYMAEAMTEISRTLRKRGRPATRRRSM